ncbi:hypothetical protein ASC77_01840 [Nocardioides sp. Root1257]|uniref:type IV toxin-antitoxin system AbiEi family antitoxin domain-containing protein n=1 Tax=unclassified Nocardioides TaxID=2615069 RepID=UPI0006FDE2D0|nr:MULTISPECIES: type IV toxin-antitoxin system AbiEi family antitoxin domain-containing protein [unclassified Nocardioides]KQW53066.1 hypothetical protein ASC77_01840 [Nocardioides sp. Root1257]KRC55754.1 hypothetical protein ASE24_01840 [Nocardioides sp. Root224]
MTHWPDVPFTRAELAGLGLAATDLRRGQRDGDVRRILRGVFVAARLDDTLELRAVAAAKATPEGHVIVDRTAAWLHGVDMHAYGELDGIPPVETCALRWSAPTTLGGIAGRTRDLRPEDQMRIGGVCVTTPLRTALDLGCCLRRREAFAALCMIARAHHHTRHDYVRALSRYRRRRGVVQLRELVALVDTRFESQREAWCFLAIADAELPHPEPQVWIEVDGAPTYRLDLAYRRLRVCVEYDGHDAHSSEQQREHDRKRRQWLTDHGWTVVVVREGDFTGEGLERWLRELRAALTPAYTSRRW